MADMNYNTQGQSRGVNTHRVQRYGLATILLMIFLIACELPVQLEVDPVLMPIFNRTSGEVLNTEILTIITPTESATIYYSTDGSAPGTAGPAAASSATVNFDRMEAGTVTIKAIAVKDGHPNSVEASIAFTITPPAIASPDTPVATPTFNLEELLSAHSVTISTTTDGATVYYSTDGSDPGTAGPAAASLATLNFGPTRTGTITIKAIAMKEGHDNSAEASTTFTIIRPQTAVLPTTPKVATPTFNLEELLSAHSVTISTSTDGATIYYSTDGSDPITAGPAAASSARVNFGSTRTGDITIKAIAMKEGHDNSAEASTTFTIIRPPTAVLPTTPKVATPTFNLDEILSAHVTISTSTDGATIYYSTDGSAPITAGPGAASPARVNFGSTRAGDITIKAIAMKEGHDNSAEASTTFTIVRPPIAVLPYPPPTVTITIFDPPAVLPDTTPKVAMPTFNLEEILSAHVTISTSTDGATIYYSTDGSDPITVGPRSSLIGKGELCHTQDKDYNHQGHRNERGI